MSGPDLTPPQALRRWHVAWHEAAHAVAAMEMNLPVDWVDIDAGYAEGVHFAAAVHIPDEEIDRERDAKAIAVAMACPSFVDVHDQEINDYAQLEAEAAYEMAESFGISRQEVADEAEHIAIWQEDEIKAFAILLEERGKVVLGDRDPA